MVPTRGFPDMPGEWEGTAVYVTPDGKVLSRRRLTVSCRIDGNVMSITNVFTDEAGAAVEAKVRGEFDDAGRFHLRSERTEGLAWETDGNIIAAWHLIADPTVTFYELATLHGGVYRTRTWHHLRNGVLEGVTVFEERKVGPAPSAAS